MRALNKEDDKKFAEYSKKLSMHRLHLQRAKGSVATYHRTNVIHLERELDRLSGEVEAREIIRKLKDTSTPKSSVVSAWVKIPGIGPQWIYVDDFKTWSSEQSWIQWPII